jgi:hypothetical protein
MAMSSPATTEFSHSQNTTLFFELTYVADWDSTIRVQEMEIKTAGERLIETWLSFHCRFASKIGHLSALKIGHFRL